MPTLPAVIVTLLLPFEHLFDPRTWRKVQLLVVGARLPSPTVSISEVGSVEKVQRWVTAEIRATNIVLRIVRLVATGTSRNFIVSTFGSSGPTNVPCNSWS